MQSILKSNVTILNKVGPKRENQYKKMGVDSVDTLLRYYPREYIDYTQVKPIKSTIPGETYAVKATVYDKKPPVFIRKGMTIFKVLATDGESNFTITIFNNKYMYDMLRLEKEYIFYGKMQGNLVRKEMVSPIYIEADREITMQPVYRLTEGLNSKMIAENVQEALNRSLDELVDPLPSDLRQENQLCGLHYALQNIHFPKDSFALEIAKKRLIFEELLVLQLGMLLLKQRNRANTSVQLFDMDIQDFYKKLPFTLTGAQKRSILDCLQDMTKGMPMNRLIQGDVGSGKTMVAAAAAYACVKNGYQSALMAPTEILATQHFATLVKVLTPLSVSIELLTGALTPKQKQEIKMKLQTGQIDLVVGTHAIVQETTVFRKLGLVITDEQHRFGVAQRAALANKGDNPHVMVMSATPIPRTLALIVYGDLDVSVIDELPKGRQVIKTFSIQSDKRDRALSFIAKEIDKGRQAYIVCPLIEEGESEMAAATQYAESLRENQLSHYKVGLLHGKMKADEKEQIMQAFKKGDIDILVSTTVIEVGVDVPNATVMLIENSERFGLSQLHQLRGRVGRGKHQSYCILISDHATKQNIQRLKVMRNTTDGFKIAEEDLKLRGPGDFFGEKQHGLPHLKIANMLDNMEVLKYTQKTARKILNEDNELLSIKYRELGNEVSALFAHKTD